MPYFLGSQQIADELWALRNGNEDCANFVETPGIVANGQRSFCGLQQTVWSEFLQDI